MKGGEACQNQNSFPATRTSRKFHLGVSCGLLAFLDSVFSKKDQEQFGENAALLEGLSPEILPDAYKVTVDDLSQFDSTVGKIKKFESVLQVRENSDLANKVETVRNAVSYISLGIIAILFFVSMFIVSNTIRITIYNRRLEISIMKAVGATNSFIRWPFLVEGMLLGYNFHTRCILL